uniref:DUF4587 domain-containing protein n=1 Tax=Seriola dumerili TaxID=41447 RepID=A0A3B4VL34_SERDU
ILFSAIAPPGTEPHYSLISPPQAPQQPTAILQQLPATMMPPGLAPSIRPGGHVKEDLVELMMIQNAQMHQVIMNNMTMSALGSSRSPGPPDLVIIQDTEADPEIYHHYYQSAPYLSCPSWLLPSLVYQEDPNKPTSRINCQSK